MSNAYLEFLEPLMLQQKGHTSPNPRTIACVVLDHEIVGIGVHQGAGTPHAERLALLDAGARAKGATLIVNLEPCTHHGATPPCTDAIIQAGIAKVVFTLYDPNPIVRKHPAEAILTQQGIDVQFIPNHKPSYRWHDIFIKNQILKRPFVHLKAAISMDGKLSTTTGESTYISNEACLKRVHELRLIYDSVLVGMGTLTSDCPQLSIRYCENPLHYQPAIIILDKHNEWCDDHPYVEAIKHRRIFLITHDQGTAVASQLSSIHVIPQPLNDAGHFSLDSVGEILFKQGICSVLMEGGGRVFTSALVQKWIDKCTFHIAPILLGGSSSNTVIKDLHILSLNDKIALREVDITPMGQHVEMTGYLNHPLDWYATTT